MAKDWAQEFIAKPFLFLVGLYVCAVLIAAFAGIKWNLFPALFTATGGIPALGYYYKRKLNED